MTIVLTQVLKVLLLLIRLEELGAHLTRLWELVRHTGQELLLLVYVAAIVNIFRMLAHVSSGRLLNVILAVIIALEISLLITLELLNSLRVK